MSEPLHRSTPVGNEVLGEVLSAQAEQVICGEGLRSQSFDPEGSYSIAADGAVLLTTENGQEDAVRLQIPTDLSRESLQFSSIHKASGSWGTRPPSPSGSDVDQNIEMRPLKSDSSGDRHASPQKTWYFKKPLPNKAKLWVLVQLGIPYIIATAVMGIHLGFFRYLHDKPVNETISQGLQSAIANLLAFVIGTALSSIIAVAYNQTIWHLFSSKFLKAKIIDKLVTLTSNPWNILHLELFREAPWQWSLVWCCIFVPIACNFPPGALTVVDGKYKVDQRVPTLNASITGNGTFTDLRRYALFDTAVGLNYAGPREDLKNIAIAVLMTGEAYDLPGPCSSLCNYSLEFQGPFWDCEDIDPTPWPERDEYYKEQSQYFPTIFSASTDQHRATDQNNPLTTPDLLMETLVFQWYPGLNISNKSGWLLSPNSTQQRANIKPPKQINCTTKVVNYKTDISYDERGHRTIRWDIENKTSAIDAMPVRMNYNKILVERAPSSSPQDINVEFSADAQQNYITTQLHTIHDAALEPLLGYLFGFYSYFSETTYNFAVRGNGTLIGGTRFVHVALDDPVLKVDITVTALEEYLFNVTLSTIALNNMNNPQWLTAEPISVWDRTSIYSFDQQIQFYVPYAISLAATTLVAIAGIWCLLMDGASAGNGFLQYVSTTRISNSLQQLGLGSSRGGEENFSEELRDTKFLFGVQHLKDSGSGYEQSEGSTTVAYGFGEEHEVQPF